LSNVHSKKQSSSKTSSFANFIGNITEKKGEWHQKSQECRTTGGKAILMRSRNIGNPFHEGLQSKRQGKKTGNRWLRSKLPCRKKEFAPGWPANQDSKKISAFRQKGTIKKSALTFWRTKKNPERDPFKSKNQKKKQKKKKKKKRKKGERHPKTI